MPLMFDMPLNQLESYAGTNPRPTDFDSFWEKSLADMRAVNPEIKLIPAEFKTSFADCYHLYFTGLGGARIHAKLLRPHHSSGPRPAVIMFHGYAGNAADWFGKLPYAAQGFTVVAMDCRGQGGLSEDVGGVVGNTLNGHIIRGLDDAPEKMLFRQIFLDTAQLTDIVMAMPDVDESRVGVTGGSQGGGLSLACAALEPRIKLAAPLFPFLSDYQRIWDIDLDIDAYAELREYFRRFDPLHQREEEVFTRLGYIDVQHFCPRIQAEVFMGVGLMDKICPPSTQFAAYNKINASKSMAIYPDFGHEQLLIREHNDRVFEFLATL
jgi:cephalosporin-C deacetylase